ncbi:MAG: acetyl-CoA C-acyltransferase, partial [Vulcanimicrobiaceae bacterium]
MNDAFICDGIRTPIGRYGGALAGVRADDLAAIPLAALVARNPQVAWEQLDEVYLGCAGGAGEDNRNVARMALLLAGLPPNVAGATVNRLCGSGMEAIGAAARAIRCGESELALAGGVESMSRAPFVIGKAESAFARGTQMFDTTIGWRFVNPKMRERYGIDSMPETAENVAAEYHVSREDQDAFALRSQERAAAAQRSGRFAAEIVPIEVANGKHRHTVAHDEHLRPETTLAALARLPTPFRSPGTVTAGNASGINDGAAALLLASERAVRTHGLVPKARIAGMASAGVVPRLMGIGPAPACEKLLGRLDIPLEACDVIELNEAFAAQALAVLRLLGL